MDKEEAVATLKYSLDQHLKGNRSPFTLTLQSAYYSTKVVHDDAPTDAEARRSAIMDFLEYAKSKSGVQFESYANVLKWMRNPTTL